LDRFIPLTPAKGLTLLDVARRLNVNSAPRASRLSVAAVRPKAGRLRRFTTFAVLFTGRAAGDGLSPLGQRLAACGASLRSQFSLLGGQLATLRIRTAQRAYEAFGFFGQRLAACGASLRSHCRFY